MQKSTEPGTSTSSWQTAVAAAKKASMIAKRATTFAANKDATARAARIVANQAAKFARRTSEAKKATAEAEMDRLAKNADKAANDARGATDKADAAQAKYRVALAAQDAAFAREQTALGVPDTRSVDFAKYSRAEAPLLDPQNTSLVFQQMEIDQEHNRSRNAVASRLFGMTEDGHSVVCYVQGFFPYFYCPAPDGFKEEYVSQVVAELNRLAQSTSGGGSGGGATTDAVVGVEMCMKEPMFRYHDNKKAPFFKIIVRNPKLVQSVSQIVERGFNVPGIGACNSKAFEADIDCTIRFMADTGIVGASWVELPVGKYSVRSNRSTSCQYEVDIDYKDLIAHEPVGEWSKMAPLRILSFDIECAGRPGIFPEAKTNPVVQIANVVTLLGQKQPFIRNVFTLNTCVPIPNADVLSFQTEDEMLQRWSQFVQACDPDVIIGYNSTDFDFPYLLERARLLKVAAFPFLGRVKDVKTAAAGIYGIYDSKYINMAGRIHFDVIVAMRCKYVLDSYKLNSVTKEFLGEQKEEVEPADIPRLQNKSPETRQRLAEYCLKDAILPQRLVDKLGILVDSMETARVTGVPFNYMFSRGSPIRTVSQILRHSSRQGLVVLVGKSLGDIVNFDRATFCMLKRGYYDLPIVKIGYAVQGMGIMMERNLCYTTLLTRSANARLKLIKDVDYVVTPTSDWFVKPSKHVGLLPHIAKELLAEREQTKIDLSEETDPIKRQLLNSRQLALKNSADSFYQFTGNPNGGLPCLQISTSVAAFSRKMINEAIAEIEQHFSVVKGRTHDAEVIFGDRNSILIKFGVQEPEDALKLGQEAAEHSTTKFVNQIAFEFKKVYPSCLLIDKKYWRDVYWDKAQSRNGFPLESLELDICLENLSIFGKDTDAVEFVKGVIAEPDSSRLKELALVIAKTIE
ncbi:DNA-directed DNA polymerase delta [Coemansia sp. RSA 1836]|nr:DNA-directed DNA polymerase delta [Coemansia sp. RSA 1836]